MDLLLPALRALRGGGQVRSGIPLPAQDPLCDRDGEFTDGCAEEEIHVSRCGKLK